MNELILYTTEDGQSHIQLRANDGTVWLTQREMAELFQVSTDNIGLHLKNIYADGELAPEATTGAMLISGVWSDLKKRRILLVDHRNDHNQQKRIRHDRFYP